MVAMGAILTLSAFLVGEIDEQKYMPADSSASAALASNTPNKNRKERKKKDRSPENRVLSTDFRSHTHYGIGIG